MSDELTGVLIACSDDRTIRLIDIVEPVDIGLVDSLARLHLTARRFGLAVQVRDACPQLSELLELAGLTNLLAHGEPSSESTPSAGATGDDER